MSEMLDPKVFTTWRRGWQAKVRIKHLLTDEDNLTPEQINEIGKSVASALKLCKSFDDEDIIYHFEHVDDMEEFNGFLTEMYDYCDDARIWVE